MLAKAKSNHSDPKDFNRKESKLEFKSIVCIIFCNMLTLNRLCVVKLRIKFLTEALRLICFKLTRRSSPAVIVVQLCHTERKLLTKILRN
jgi:hypothetical protein